MMYRLREGPRFDYREQESLRVKESPSLASKFPQLKSLTVDLGYYNAAGVARTARSNISRTWTRQSQCFDWIARTRDASAVIST